MTPPEKVIICFSPDDWDEFEGRQKHLMTKLSQCYKILYLESPVTPLVTLIKHRKRWFHWLVGRGKTRELGHNLYAYRLFLPFHFRITFVLPILRRINYLFSSFALSRTMKRLKLAEPLLWVVKPYWLEWIDIFQFPRKQLLVYDCQDDYSAMCRSKSEAKRVEENERKLLVKADLVLAASTPLASEKGRFSPNVHLVRNGVDTDQFKAEPDYYPDELSTIPRPIIGYIGNVALVDLSLITYVARSRPDWSVVLIGAAGREARRLLPGLSNIWLLRRRPYRELANFVNRFDVCLLPIKRNELMDNADTLKLYEYLAVGKPVVSVDFPQAREFEEVVEVASTPQEFVGKISAALAGDNSEKAAHRRKVAQRNSWQNRAQLVMELIEEAFTRKGASR